MAETTTKKITMVAGIFFVFILIFMFSAAHYMKKQKDAAAAVAPTGAVIEPVPVEAQSAK